MVIPFVVPENMGGDGTTPQMPLTVNHAMRYGREHKNELSLICSRQ